MSVRAIAQCWGPTFPVNAPGLSPQTVRLVALAVADVVNDVHGNEFWGARRLLAEKVGIDPDTVSDVMKHLVAVGVIEVVARVPGSTVHYRWLGGGNSPLPPAATAGGDGAHTAGGAVLPPPNTKETQELTQSDASHRAAAPKFTAAQRDAMVEALAAACGMQVAEIPARAKRSISMAAQELIAIGAHPDEVERRAHNYPAHFRDAALTPAALVKHWAQLAKSPRRAKTGVAATIERMMQEDPSTGKEPR